MAVSSIGNVQMWPYIVEMKENGGGMDRGRQGGSEGERERGRKGVDLFTVWRFEVKCSSLFFHLHSSLSLFSTILSLNVYKIM